jgi:phage terminase large subunit-like protein
MATAVARKRKKAQRTSTEKAPPFERPQGKYERAAYERHARDLALSLGPDGHPKGFYYDADAGERAVQFIERFCRHHKGEWAGKPLLLEEWQKFVLRCVFGWKRADGRRRYTESYEEVGRKNGKSEVAAGVGLYLTIADDEPGAEVYCTATKEDQAKIIWSTGKEMVKQSPDLRKHVRAMQKVLVCDRNLSFFKPLGSDSDTLDGLNPHGHLCDEMHAHKKRELYDVMITGMGARRQPLTFIITTAGVYDPESIGWEMHTRAQQVLDGVVEDDYFFAIIFAADEERKDENGVTIPADDWKDPNTWYKANPNLGVSVNYDYLAEQCEKAKKQPSFLNTFLRLHLNVWTQQITRWISLDHWNACPKPVPVLTLDDVRGRVAYIGLDLSTKIDICAAALSLPDGEFYDMLWRFYVPEELVRERTRMAKKPDYAAWVRDGWLMTTPGSVVDYEFIYKDIIALSKIVQIKQLGYDPWNATQLATQLTGDLGEEVLVEMRQGMKTLSEPSKEFEKLVMDKKLRHYDNPVMRWMVDNAAIRRDANDNIAPDKRSAVGKIDGLVAGIMALGRAILEPPLQTSVYESRGVLAF